MRNTIQKLRDKLRDDSGVATIYFVIMTVGFLLIVGLVVDGAGKVQANQQAYSTAAGASRAAANRAARNGESDNKRYYDAEKTKALNQMSADAHDLAAAYFKTKYPE